MTREDAKQVICQLINSGILSEELEEKLEEVAKHICANNFEKCNGSSYCEGCQYCNS